MYPWAILAIALIVGATLFVGLKHANNNAVADRQTVCIEGVKYIMIREYQKGFMAPKFNADTLQVETCR